MGLGDQGVDHVARADSILKYSSCVGNVACVRVDRDV